MRVRMLTSWEERCGIATYSSDLVSALRQTDGVDEVEVVPSSFKLPPRTTYAAMGAALSAGDVAHVQHSYAFFGGMHPLRNAWPILAGAVRRPTLVTVHELDLRATGLLGLPPAMEERYKRWFNRCVFRHGAVGRWLVHAEELRDGLLSLGVPQDRLTYRPIPVPEPPDHRPDPAPLRKELRLEGKRPLVILGFLSRRKGYEVALAALRDLPSDIVLLAAGGEHAADRSGTEAWLRTQASEAGVADRLRITGYLSDGKLEQATALAEVVLAPFTQMSASASLSYALARRKAVIASDLPENRRLGCVRLTPPGDAQALARAIRDLVESPSERGRLEVAALAYAKENSFPALAGSTLEIYRQLIEEKSSKR